MADPPPGPDAGTDPGREPTTGPPRWVKVFAVVFVVLVVLLVVSLVAGGGDHGPGRHRPSGDAAGHAPSPSVVAHDRGRR